MTSISNGESGLSVRTKLNASLAVTDAFTVSGANVGIGVTPTAQLQISSATSGTNGIRFSATGWPYYGRLGINGTSGSEQYWSANYSINASTIDDATLGTSYVNLSANGRITFGTGTTNTAPTERMRIDASGNVGIGASPTGFNKFEVIQATNKRIGFGTAAAYGGNAIVGINDVGSEVAFGIAGTPLIFATNAVERMRIDVSGNVGIGTSSPNAASIVDAQSTTKGVRFPNMTTAQKALIANVAGNVVFDTTLGKLCVNTGSGWQTITSV